MNRLQGLYKKESSQNKTYSQELSLKKSLPSHNSKTIGSLVVQTNSNATIEDIQLLASENRRLRLQIETLEIRVKKLVQGKINLPWAKIPPDYHNLKTELEQCKEELEDTQFYYKEAMRTQKQAQ